MTTVETVEVPRDRWKRPLILPVGGGKPVAYQRASSFGDVLDDRSNLEKWKLRMAVHGLTLKPELQLAASVTSLDEKGKLNGIAQDAIDAAGGAKKSSIGTSLHTLTEMLDRGEQLPNYPAEYIADLVAYQAATKSFNNEHIERFTVCDELGVAGTPDRVTTHDEMTFDDVFTLRRALRITDLKTGGNPRYMDHYAVQLAIYSRSQFYDPATGERTPIEGVDQNWGIIYHLPSGEGHCDLYAVDLNAGWEGALLAADVRQWRKRKGLVVAASAA